MRIDLEKALSLLLADEIVAIPTETVYGLAARLSSPSAIEKIFLIKKPRNNPLIVHVATWDQLEEIALKIPKNFVKLSNHFWPGPLTMIFPAKNENVPEIVRAGLLTVAVRVPNHP